MPQFLGLPFLEIATACTCISTEHLRVFLPNHLDDKEDYVHGGSHKARNALEELWLNGLSEDEDGITHMEELKALTLTDPDRSIGGCAELLDIRASILEGYDCVDPFVGKENCNKHHLAPLPPCLEEAVDNACQATCDDVVEFIGSDLLVEEPWEDETEMVSPLCFEDLLLAEPLCGSSSMLVSLGDLLARLKQKPVADPLAMGKPSGLLNFSLYASSSDDSFDNSAPSSVLGKNSPTAEEFKQDVEQNILDDWDELLELVEPVTSNLGPVNTVHDCAHVVKELQLQSEQLDKDSNSCNELLSQLTNLHPEGIAALCATEAASDSDESPKERIKSTAHDDSGLCTECEASPGSSLGLALEEVLSPQQCQESVPLLVSENCVTQAQCVCQPLPDSTNDLSELGILSPHTKRIMETDVVNAGRMFDEESVLNLPVPVIAAKKEEQPLQPVPSLLKQIVVTDCHIGGALDLSLMWDPVAPGLPQMKKCRVVTELPSSGHVDWLGEQAEEEKAKRVNAVVEEMLQIEVALLPSQYVGHDSFLTSNNCTTVLTPGSSRGHPPKAWPPLTSAGKASSVSKNVTIPKTATASHRSLDLETFLMLRDIGKHDTAHTSPDKTGRASAATATTTVNRPSDHSSSVSALPGPRPEEEQERMRDASSVSPPCKGSADQCDYTVKHVRLQGKFFALYTELVHQIRPLLQQLQSDDILPSHLVADTVTSDEILFHVKSQLQGKSCCDLRLVRTLCILETLEVSLHCGLPAALNRLSGLREEYSNVLRGGLNSMTANLGQKHCLFESENLLHPKVLALQNVLRNWLRTKPKKHAVVLVWKHSRTLLPDLCQAIQQISGIRARVMEASHLQNLSGEDSHLELGEVNCVVVRGADTMLARWPWPSFDLAVEYVTAQCLSSISKEDAGVASSPCFQQAIARGASPIRFVLLRAVLPSRDVANNTVGPIDPFLLIASQLVMANKKLLQVLESRFNVQMVDRDYKHILGKDLDPHDHWKFTHAHIIIDERTAAMLVPAAYIGSSLEAVKSLTNSIGNLFCQFRHCLFIITFYNPFHPQGRGGRPLPPEYTSNMSLFLASTCHYQYGTRDSSGFSSALGDSCHPGKLKIMYSATNEQTGDCICRFGETAREGSQVWSPDNWARRPWITPEISLHEEFLLRLPMLNSFSAQVMLTAAPLGKLLVMSEPDLLATCPWIPQQVLKAFFSAVHYHLDGNRGFINVLSPPADEDAICYETENEITPSGLPLTPPADVNIPVSKAELDVHPRDAPPTSHGCMSTGLRAEKLQEQFRMPCVPAVKDQVQQPAKTSANTVESDLDLPNFPDGTSPYTNVAPWPSRQGAKSEASHREPIDQRFKSAKPHASVSGRSGNHHVWDSTIDAQSNRGKGSTLQQDRDFRVCPGFSQGKAKRCSADMKEHMDMLASKRLLHYPDAVGSTIARSRARHPQNIQGGFQLLLDQTGHTTSRNARDQGFYSSMMRSGDAWCENGFQPVLDVEEHSSNHPTKQPVTSRYFSQSKLPSRMEIPPLPAPASQQPFPQLMDTVSSGRQQDAEEKNSMDTVAHQSRQLQNQSNRGVGAASFSRPNLSRAQHQSLMTFSLAEQPTKLGSATQREAGSLAIGGQGWQQGDMPASCTPKTLSYERVPSLPGGQTRLIVRE